MKYIICIMALLSIAFSAEGADLKLQPYPNAREVFHATSQESSFLLALGSYKKVDSNWIVDRSQHLSGDLHRFTYELPADHNAETGFLFFKEQLDKYNLRELFHCKARDCGTSNSWANNHFKIIQLYGLDQYQFYGAYEITNADDKPFYVVLYAVMRGNKRAYVQLDILHANKVNEFGVASSPETLRKLLNTNGYFVFPDFVSKDSQGSLHLQVKQAHIQALMSLLTLEPGLRLALVGHDYSAATIAQQQIESQKNAEQIKAALVSVGVDAKRIQTYGIGSLAPAGRGDRNARVEVVKIIEPGSKK
ncbi:MAG: DUF4892 domain-containing protein [Gammaproteobacteria bacterium]|nr:MAG: DUF4892 domain-containing protein [Gammaproteobacteria bacterium]